MSCFLTLPHVDKMREAKNQMPRELSAVGFQDRKSSLNTPGCGDGLAVCKTL